MITQALGPSFPGNDDQGYSKQCVAKYSYFNNLSWYKHRFYTCSMYSMCTGQTEQTPCQLGSGISPTSPGHTISFDYQPVTTKAITGHTGYFLFKCLFSGFRYSAFVTSKSAASLISSLDSVRLFFLSHGHQLAKVRCDSGSSELSVEFNNYLRQHQIQLDPAAVNSQFQNPVEREVQTVNKGVATLFADQHLLTPAFWPYAVGPILGTAAVIPHATNNLVSPSHLISNGYDLHFTKCGAGIFRNNQQIHKGSLDPVSNLFIIDLLDLVPPPPPSVATNPTPSLPQVNTTTKTSISTRKVLDIL
jgi:hypothetical protein